MTTDLEGRAREVIGRALDAVAVDPVGAVAGQPPAPVRQGGWRTGVVAFGAVAAAVLAFVHMVPDDDDESAVSTADPTTCVADATRTVPAARIASGVRPDGGPWEVLVLVSLPATPEVNVLSVLPDRHAIPEEGSGFGHPVPPTPAQAAELPYHLAPAPGGFVLAAELPPEVVRVEVAGADGEVVTACARPVAGLDGFRYVGAFVTRDADDPPVLRAYAADGTVVAVADDVPTGTWRAGTGYRSSFRRTAERPVTTTTWTPPPATATTRATVPARPPVPTGGDPCGDDPLPFTIEDLPDGIDPTPVRYREWRRSQTPPGHEAAPELYDPAFTFLDPDDPERRVDVFHGNSWRLDLTLREQRTIVGLEAWLSDLADGSVLLDFPIDGSGDPCAIWSVRNAGDVSEAELIAAAESIVVGGAGH